jgi:hypothetical protein
MISNPILQGLTVIVNQGANVTIANSDPPSAPSQARSFWFNRVASKLFLAIATNSISDWIAIGGSGNGADAEAILSKILVQNGQVLTTEDNVIFED